MPKNIIRSRIGATRKAKAKYEELSVDQRIRLVEKALFVGSERRLGYAVCLLGTIDRRNKNDPYVRDAAPESRILAAVQKLKIDLWSEIPFEIKYIPVAQPRCYFKKGKVGGQFAENMTIDPTKVSCPLCQAEIKKLNTSYPDDEYKEYVLEKVEESLAHISFDYHRRIFEVENS